MRFSYFFSIFAPFRGKIVGFRPVLPTALDARLRRKFYRFCAPQPIFSE